VHSSSIRETIRKLSKRLDEEGNTVYIERLQRYTKELVGITLELGIEGFMDFYQPDRKEANMEIISAFNKALEILFKDKSARYAVGYPEKFSSDVIMPCISLVQILLREEPVVIAYFRSVDIKSLAADWAVLARRTFESFGSGKIIINIGSLHKYIPKVI